MLVALLVACALHAERSGMVRPEGERVWLDAYQGGRTGLILGEVGAPIRFLDGCVVEVVGVLTPAGLVVEDWHVRDAGDGSGGFVGLLRTYGGRLAIDDRNTDAMLLLDDEQVPQLRAYAGNPVLLVGTVIGPGQVRVMAFRVLREGS